MKPKKIKLVYFSPTRTTKKVLEGIAKGINMDISDVTDLTNPLVRISELPVFDNELILMGAPVYTGRLQQEAAEYFKKLKARQTPVVLVVLYGNREYEDALLELKDIAVMTGFNPIACSAFIGEHSFSGSELPLAQNRPDALDMDKAEAFGKMIAAKLNDLENMDSLKDVPVPGNKPYRDRMKLPAMDFIEVTDACTDCDICAQACPKDAINRADRYSIDPEKCIYCCACVKVCPENARVIREGMIKDIANKLSRACRERKEPETYL